MSDSASTPAETPSAMIIPFPARPKPLEPNPQDRLARALESLNAAVANQREAVASWRSVLGELKATTAGLDESLHRYRANLRSLSGSISTLHARARALEQWADTATAQPD